MSKTWIQVSEKILSQLKNSEATKKKDRLEYVRTIRFTLSALQRSLLGWIQWVNNPDIMTRFTQEDLESIDKKLSDFARTFIEYDLETTKLGSQRGLKAIKKIKKKERADTFYV